MKNLIWPKAATLDEAKRISWRGFYAALMLVIFYALGIGYAEFFNPQFYATHVTPQYKEIADSMQMLITQGWVQENAIWSQLTNPEKLVRFEWGLYLLAYLLFLPFNAIHSRSSEILFFVVVVFELMAMIARQAWMNPAFWVYIIAVFLAAQGVKGAFDFHRLRRIHKKEEKA